ncbi:MAG: undecaprenyl-phosphate glucose phosphotransferase, partial [Psychroserpens sp.]
MSLFKQGRYSGYLRPISYLIDLCIINGLAILYFFKDIDPNMFIPFVSITWIIISIYSRFYEVYRYTREVTIFSLSLRQMVLFMLIVFAFIGFHPDLSVFPITVFKYVLVSFLLIISFKFA